MSFFFWKFFQSKLFPKTSKFYFRISPRSIIVLRVLKELFGEKQLGLKERLSIDDLILHLNVHSLFKIWNVNWKCELDTKPNTDTTPTPRWLFTFNSKLNFSLIKIHTNRNHTHTHERHTRRTHKPNTHTKHKPHGRPHPSPRPRPRPHTRRSLKFFSYKKRVGPFQVPTPNVKTLKTMFDRGLFTNPFKL